MNSNSPFLSEVPVYFTAGSGVLQGWISCCWLLFFAAVVISRLTSVGVVFGGKPIVPHIAGWPHAVSLTEGLSTATVKLKKVNALIGFLRIAADTKKNHPAQKTWMIHLQHRCVPGIRSSRKIKEMALTRPMHVIFVGEPALLLKNFPEEDMAGANIKLFRNPTTLWRYQMKKLFSPDELFELRNFIPINMVIAEVLQMPSKIAEGHFRFLCPACNEFQTATNASTNLARCFCCKKNFNAIDLVMIVRHSGFVESVSFLKDILSTYQMREVNR